MADLIAEQPLIANEIAKIVITCNIKTGSVEVGGHIDNTYLVLQMLMEAGHLIMNRNLLKDLPTGKPA